MSILLGVDVGGTFTDFVAYDHAGRSLEVWKVPSVPGDPVSGILAGLEGFAGKDSVEAIRLGTTVATNAVLERKGATVAYVTTRGHQDVVFIQRGNRRWHYDMSWVKPKPLVKRRDCFELNERVDAYGEVLVPLDPAEVVEVARRDPRAPGDPGRRRVPALLLPEPDARADGEAHPRGRARPGHAGLGVLRGPAQVEGVRAGLDDDRGRLSAARGDAPALADARPPGRGGPPGRRRRDQVQRRRDDARRRGIRSR